jgi:protein-S-isoprenylcysteine O-methyltransferase Ste14
MPVAVRCESLRPTRMHRLSTPPAIEEMGLRREDTAQLRPLDAVLVVALVLSGVIWVWVSLVGVDPNLVAALASPAGRVLAAAVGLASVAAVIRAFLVLRWPVTDNDRNLL